MKVRFKKLHPDAVTPKYAHDTDAGMDLTATGVAYDCMGNVIYSTGIAVEIPKGYVGLLFPRSSISEHQLHLANAVGVIDSGYRGEITMKFRPALRFQNMGLSSFCPMPYKYKAGDRIGQLIIMPYPHIELEEADELSGSDRGEGGYGSTGK